MLAVLLLKKKECAQDEHSSGGKRGDIASNKTELTLGILLLIFRLFFSFFASAFIALHIYSTLRAYEDQGKINVYKKIWSDFLRFGSGEIRKFLPSSI